MALSKDYTAATVWAEAVRGSRIADLQFTSFERFTLINRAQNDVAGEIYPSVMSSYLTSASPTNTNDVIDISTLRMQRMAVAHMILQNSSLTSTSCRAVSPEELVGFRNTDQHSIGEIVYTVQGDSILLEKGSNVTYGTWILQYIRLPIQVAADADFIDIPDGPACHLVILRLQKILSMRYEMPPKDYQQEMAITMQALYNSLGISVKEQELESKVEALS